jgi:hypothetical protein
MEEVQNTRMLENPTRNALFPGGVLSEMRLAEHLGLDCRVGGRFDPEEFDPGKATKAMRKGLPDWGSMAG